jgi:hypothetical protein
MAFDPLAIESVRKLRLVENQFVQVLITSFRLKRRTTGVELSVAFDLDAPAITTRPMKAIIQQAVANFKEKSQELQERLNDFLLKGKGEVLDHSDASFPFRYASGGVLPIVRWNKRDYYCLFYRDIFPIGWNIANGGCLTREELLNPAMTAQRELTEELVVANRYTRTFGTFADENGRPLPARPQANGAIWREVFGDAVHLFENANIPTKWSAGPDSVKIEIAGEGNRIDNCFVTINAQDFGIEIDKVMKIAPDPDSVFCDGEQTGSFLVNRLVGLFPLDDVEGQIQRDEKFVPKIFFLSGRTFEEKDFHAIVREELVSSLKDFRSLEEINLFTRAIDNGSHLNLCPVSRQIISRYLQYTNTRSTSSSCTVFISYGGADEDIARKLYNELRHVVDTFFFPEYLHKDILDRSIDDSLDSAKCLVVVGSSLNNIYRDRCAYEWRRFCREWSANLKSSDTVVLPFMSSDLNPEDLPRELRGHFVVSFRPASFDKDIQELARRIPSEFRRSAVATSAGQ